MLISMQHVDLYATSNYEVNERNEATKSVLAAGPLGHDFLPQADKMHNSTIGLCLMWAFELH